MNFELGEDWFKNKKLLSKVLNSKFDKTKPLTFAEVGSWKGRSAIWFIENFLRAPGSVLYCIDTWNMNDWNDFNQEKQLLQSNPQRAKELKVDEIYDQFIFNITHKGMKDKVVTIRNKSAAALNSLDNEFLDFIYIDGDHSEKGCYDDLAATWPKVKKGGILFGDDWKWKHKGIYPVQDAVHRFSKENNIKVLPVFFHGNGYYFIK
jgi:predicted O-methyltransferase YrrM